MKFQKMRDMVPFLISYHIWRSHGQFDIKSCPVQYPWLMLIHLLGTKEAALVIHEQSSRII